MEKETNEMSSEEVENQETTEVEATGTEEKIPAVEPEPEPSVPLHAHTALRARAQAAEVNAAELRGRLAQVQESSALPVVSPLDAEIARQTEEGIAQEDMSISPAVIRADKLYEKQIATQEAKTVADQTLVNKQAASLLTAQGKHADCMEVINAGMGLLTPGESLDAKNAGDNFGETAYIACQKAIARNKPEETTSAAPKPSKPAVEKVLEPAAPSQTEILKNASPEVAAAAAL